MTDLILLLIIIIEKIFIVFLHLSHKKEVERMQLFIKSENPESFVQNIKSLNEKTPKEDVIDEDPYLEIDDVPPEKLIKATDNI